ncbi:MAG: hypothetical protein AAFX50_16795, partial [Acidobacteriota bacterium]
VDPEVIVEYLRRRHADGELTENERRSDAEGREDEREEYFPTPGEAFRCGGHVGDLKRRGGTKND